MKAIDRSEVKIRSMVSSDIFSTLNIWWADIPRKEVLASQLGGEKDLSLIAEYEGCLVGFVLARLIYAGLPISGVCVVLFMAVNPDYQNRGIGHMLLDTLKDNCKAKWIETLRLLVPKYDPGLKKYAEKMGFNSSSVMNFDCSVYPDYQL